MSLSFREELVNARRVVVKVGSNVITREDGKCDQRTLRIIVEDICELADNGIEVILVSSGAVSIGKAFLRKHLPDGKVDLDQSASSIGQPKLINKYSALFSEHSRICSQILLTHDDFRNRDRFLNAKRTVEVLLKNKIVPILNENDSISYQQITVGDNDHLAAQTAQMVNADALLVITSAKGLYDRDPADPAARLIHKVKFGDDLSHIDMSSKTSSGRGGMSSKIEAINKATQMGIIAIIASKSNSRMVLDPLTKQLGTVFSPKAAYDPERRSAWLVSTRRSNCFIEVDEDACEAILQGDSVNPEGVVKAEGHFFRGDSIDIRHEGEVIAYGVSEYSRAEVSKIQQSKSEEIEDVLGFKPSSQVVRSSNLVICEVNNNGKFRKKVKAGS